jgi:Tfp pilus assembly protein PilN
MRKLQVIKQLKANKSGPVRMLDELAMSTPDKLQLVSLEESAGRLKITGISVSNEVISQFLSNLEQSEYFTDVYLNAIDQTEQEGVRLKSFSITARLVVPGTGDDAL